MFTADERLRSSSQSVHTPPHPTKQPHRGQYMSASISHSSQIIITSDR